MEIKTVTAVGSRWKPVVCEECGHRFEYAMSRTGSASMTDILDPLGTGRDGLGDAAKYELEYRLKNETELMPCPSCGAYQSDMIHPMELRPMWLVGGLEVGLMLVLVILDVMMPNTSIPTGLALMILLVAGAGAYRPLAKYSERLWNRAYESSYARLNADRDRNRRRAAKFAEKGMLRDSAVQADG